MSEFVDRALVYHSQAGGNGPLWRELLRGGFDASVDFTGRDRSALMTLVAHAPRRLTSLSALRGTGGGWRRLCYNLTSQDNVRSLHTVDHYLHTVANLGIPGASGGAEVSPYPTLCVPWDAAERARECLALQRVLPGHDFIAVHPGTARPEKYWSAERWARVIDFCQLELGVLCVLTGGRGDPVEEDHLARIRAVLTRPCVDLGGKLDLLTLTAVLGSAKLVLGVDSGPMHLAAAASRRPQIVLFGPTNPFHWRPRHPGGLVLQAGHGDHPLSAPNDFSERSTRAPMEAISTDAVINCIKNLPTPASPLPADAS